MKNVRKASYNILRTFVLAVVWLSLAPILTGSYATSHDRELQIHSTGESVAYQTNGFSVIYKNQFSETTLGRDVNGNVIDYF